MKTNVARLFTSVNEFGAICIRMTGTMTKAQMHSSIIALDAEVALLRDCPTEQLTMVQVHRALSALELSVARLMDAMVVPSGDLLVNGRSPLVAASL